MSHIPTLEQTSKHIKFSPAVSGHLDKATGGEKGEAAGGAFLGHVSSDGTIACLAKGASLELVYLERNERLAAWTFCTSQLEPGTEITALLPFATDRNDTRSSHVLVGLDCGLNGGLLCVFDISGSKVIRAISVSQPVSSLALVSVAGGPSVPAHFHPALRYFHGIVGVGTVGGRVLLVDLALDENSETTDSQPASLTSLAHPFTRRDFPGWRREVIGRGSHLALDLSSRSVRGDIFYWEEVSSYRSSQPSTRKEVQFAMEEVEVTALHYCPNVISLAVGHNLGTWSLFSLQTLQVEHSSAYNGSQKPVQAITFQEPENDPRNYVYYWVLRSFKGADEVIEDGLAVASLYSLTYAQKQAEMEADEGTVALYTGLEAVSLRFEHILRGEPGHEEAAFSWGVHMYTLELPLSNPNRDNSDLDQVKDLGLSVMVWKTAHSISDDHPATYLGVFDLNAWYQAQMPGCYQPDGDELCSYLSFSSIESAGGKSGGILDVCVIRDSISKFSGAETTLEQHCFPSSLKFDLVVLTASGYVRASHLGIQRRVLSELACRPAALVQPSELYQLCLMAGLGGQTANYLEPSLLAQRELLLNVALEHNMVGLIVAAARDWADGRYSKSGCSLRFLLEWAWRRVGVIKERLDFHTVPLFDHSLVEADESCRHLLVKLSGQLAQLCGVLTALSAASGTLSQQGLQELECRQNVTGLVLLYTQAVSWFVNVGLLPEQPPGPPNPYPVHLLTESYREKRRKLGGLTRSYGRAGLLVDILCDDVGDSLVERFQKSGGVGDYPPPSLHALLSIFLTDSPAPAKIRLVQYFFLDLAHLLTEEVWADLVDNLIKFPSAFSLPPSIIKLTQAFWLLDHEDWEDSVCMMLDPLLQDDDLSPAHHRAVLTSLLAQNQFALALKYTRIRRPPILKEEDVQLHISVLLANGAIQEAYTFQRSQRGAPARLLEFYQRAEELARLDAVLQLSLSRPEEEEFVRFLEESKRPDSQEVLLMYYLQRSRFTEAVRLHENLRSLGSGSKSAARDAIMERYSHILPGLAKLGLSRPLLRGPAGPYTRPQPVAVAVQEKNISLFSRSSSIQQQLATPAKPVPVSHTPFRMKQQPVSQLMERMESVKRKVVDYPTLRSFPSPAPDTTQNDLVSPPSKRTRLCDVSSLDMSAKPSRRLSRVMTADALTILSTPVIRKKERVHISPYQQSYRQAITPQSILKVKSLMREATPTLEDEGTPDRRGSVEGLESRSRETTPGKSLRFQVPKRLPPVDVRVPPPEGEAHTTIFNLDMESPVAELASSSDREISFQVPVHMVDSHSFHRMTVRKVSESSKHSAEDSYHSLNTTESFEDVSSAMDMSVIDTLDTVDEGRARTCQADDGLEEKEKYADKEIAPEQVEQPTGDDYRKAVEEEEEAAAEDSDEDYYANRIFERKECNIYVEPESAEVDVTTGGDEKEAAVMLTQDDEDSDEKHYENRVFQKKECDIYVVSSEEESDSEGEGQANLNFSWAPEGWNPKLRKSLAPLESQRQKEAMKRILSEAEQELEQQATEQLAQEKQQPEEDEEDVVVVVEDGEEEIRLSSVSTVVLDDTETHILPSGSFLDSTGSEGQPAGVVLEIESDEEEVPNIVVASDSFLNSSTEESNEVGGEEAEEEGKIEVLEEEEKIVQASSFRGPVVFQSRPSSSLSFSYDTVTTQVERESGMETRFQLSQVDTLEARHEEITPGQPLDIANAFRIAEQDLDFCLPAPPQEVDSRLEKDPPHLEGDVVDLLGAPEEHQDEEEMEVENSRDMRDLLDQVSTTATRASSVAGSLFSDIAASSLSCEPIDSRMTSPEPQWAGRVGEDYLSMAAAGGAIGSDPDSAHLNSKGEVAVSALLEEERKELKQAEENYQVAGTLRLENEQEKPLESVDKGPNEEDSSGSEDEDEEEDGPMGLEFSWTAVAPPASRLSIQQIVQLEFSRPLVEGSILEELNESAVSFEFAQPVDVSMVDTDEDKEEQGGDEGEQREDSLAEREELLELRLAELPVKQVAAGTKLLQTDTDDRDVLKVKAVTDVEAPDNKVLSEDKVAREETAGDELVLTVKEIHSRDTSSVEDSPEERKADKRNIQGGGLVERNSAILPSMVEDQTIRTPSEEDQMDQTVEHEMVVPLVDQIVEISTGADGRRVEMPMSPAIEDQSVGNEVSPKDESQRNEEQAGEKQKTPTTEEGQRAEKQGTPDGGLSSRSLRVATATPATPRTRRGATLNKDGQVEAALRVEQIDMDLEEAIDQHVTTENLVTDSRQILSASSATSTPTRSASARNTTKQLKFASIDMPGASTLPRILEVKDATAPQPSAAVTPVRRSTRQQSSAPSTPAQSVSLRAPHRDDMIMAESGPAVDPGAEVGLPIGSDSEKWSEKESGVNTPLKGDSSSRRSFSTGPGHRSDTPVVKIYKGRRSSVLASSSMTCALTSAEAAVKTRINRSLALQEEVNEPDISNQAAKAAGTPLLAENSASSSPARAEKSSKESFLAEPVTVSGQRSRNVVNPKEAVESVESLTPRLRRGRNISGLEEPVASVTALTPTLRRGRKASGLLEPVADVEALTPTLRKGKSAKSRVEPGAGVEALSSNLTVAGVRALTQSVLKKKKSPSLEEGVLVTEALTSRLQSGVNVSGLVEPAAVVEAPEGADSASLGARRGRRIKTVLDAETTPGRLRSEQSSNIPEIIVEDAATPERPNISPKERKEAASPTPKKSESKTRAGSVRRTPRSSNITGMDRTPPTPLLYAPAEPVSETKAAANTPRRVSKRVESPSEGPLTPSRRSSRIASVGADQQLLLAPDGGVIARVARTPGTGGRSARRHTSVRAEDVATALNLAPLLEEEAETQTEASQGVGSKPRKTKSSKPSLPTLEEEEKGQKKTGVKQIKNKIADGQSQAKEIGERRRTEPVTCVSIQAASAPDLDSEEAISKGGRRGRRYKSITLGYNADDRLFTPDRLPAKRSRAEAGGTSGSLPAPDLGGPAAGVPGVRKYVVHKKKTTRRIQ